MARKSDVRILWLGTPRMSAEVLAALLDRNYRVVGVVAQPDRPAGRGNKSIKAPTKVLAEEREIPVFQPPKIREDYSFVKELEPDLILTLAYGQIIPEGMIEIPRLGCLNFHASLLPKLRGAAPIRRALMNGDAVTGVTLMEMVAKMDAGRMYAKEEVGIDPDDNCTSLTEKLTAACIRIIDEYLPLYLDGKLPGEGQDEGRVTFARKLRPEEEKLDPNEPAAAFLNHVRALSLEPGGYLYLNDKKLKILKAHLTGEKTNAQAGTLSLGRRSLLALQDGLIELDLVQLEGKKAVSGAAFANGHRKLDGILLR